MPAPEIAVVVQQVQMLFAPQDVYVERVREGQSTYVYRVESGGTHFYARVLPELHASFAPEVYVHELLHSYGVRVPDVIYFEHYNAVLQGSLMITTEIPGQAIGYPAPPSYAYEIVRQAGRELAIINAVPVQGFGWIQRNEAVVKHLQAEYERYDEWLTEDFGAAIAALSQHEALSQSANRTLKRLLDEARQLFSSAPAMLAHGDFDVTHIYYHNARYTGIIDFGEIRGAQPLYDLGHFAIENTELLPALLAGYAEITVLPSDYLRRIDLAGLLIAARRVGRCILSSSAPHAPDVRYIQRLLNIQGDGE